VGVRTGFVLVAGLTQREVLDRLGMRLGAVVAEPDTSDTDLPALGPVLDGWAVIVDSPGLLLTDEAALERLSRDTTLVTQSLNETVMYADAAGYQDGQRRWRVASGDDPPNWPRAGGGRFRRRQGMAARGSRLTVEGDPPGDVPALLAAAQRSEATDPGVELASGHHDVDHQIEVPSQVVAAATGGAFDGWPLDESWTFRELIPVAPAIRGHAGPTSGAPTGASTGAPTGAPSGAPSRDRARRRWLAYLLAWAALIGAAIQNGLEPDGPRDPLAWAPFAARMAVTLAVLVAAFLLLPRNRRRRFRAVTARVIGLIGIAWALTGVALLSDGDYKEIADRLVHTFVLLAIGFFLYPKNRPELAGGVAEE
jgi:hypothetical protein